MDSFLSPIIFIGFLKYQLVTQRYRMDSNEVKLQYVMQFVINTFVIKTPIIAPNS